MYSAIARTLSPFDRDQCETQAWTVKYAPASAAEVLQSGREAQLLRDWLVGSTVVAVEKVRAHDAQDAAGRKRASKPKKRKRGAEELDGFIVSSDEEADTMDVITDPEDEDPAELGPGLPKKSVVRAGDGDHQGAGLGKKLTNGVLISGPHGSGKTAAAYAVAKELGFEVFEINAGSRRGGKDVLEKVGDMTRNHLVKRGPSLHGQPELIDEDLTLVSDSLQRDLESGRQGTMNSFFASKDPRSSKSKAKVTTKTKPKRVETPKEQPQQTQKQSLILLEEVDVLFEEDKQFWSTVLALMMQSRRPVIMTCNDESLVPLEELSLHAILRFAAPPEDLAADYLLLLAAREGHLLRRHAVMTLYRSKRSDLRASISELDFWCQMAVGDRKGGLEWLFERWPPGLDHNERGEKIRVASEDTYSEGMGWWGHSANDGTSGDDELLRQAWDGWSVDVGDWLDHGDGSSQLEASPTLGGKDISLRDFESFLDHLSAADAYAGRGLPGDLDTPLDPTQPPMSDKIRPDVQCGYPIVDTEPMAPNSRFSTRIALDVKASARHALRGRSAQGGVAVGHYDGPTTPQANYLVKALMHRDDTIERRCRHAAAGLAYTLSPLMLPPKTSLLPPVSQYSLALHRPTAVVAEDVAPFVRFIIAFDVRLEEHRKKLSNLLSEGGRNGKRLRTTRASRSALEGGARQSTRRERWFSAPLNAILVARTAGHGWQEAALAELGDEQGLQASQESARRSRSTSSASSPLSAPTSRPSPHGVQDLG